MSESLPIDLIEPLHAANSKPHLQDLIADMREHGWSGRPLLVIQRGKKYFAWTGSHRIAAAKKAGLERVPCYILPESRLPDEIDAQYGHVEDYERLQAIIKTGDQTAIHIMWQE